MAQADIICPKRRLRRLVAEAFGIEEHVLLGRSRLGSVVRARYAFAYVARTWWPTMSYPRLGAMLGGRDHSTIIHGLRQLREWLERDAELQAKVSGLLACRPSDRHDAHVRAWHDELGRREAERRRIELLAAKVTPLSPHFDTAVARGVAAVSAGRRVKPKNVLVDDDVDALRRRSASNDLSAAIRAAGGWR